MITSKIIYVTWISYIDGDFNSEDETKEEYCIRMFICSPKYDPEKQYTFTHSIYDFSYDFYEIVDFEDTLTTKRKNHELTIRQRHSK